MSTESAVAALTTLFAARAAANPARFGAPGAPGVDVNAKPPPSAAAYRAPMAGTGGLY